MDDELRKAAGTAVDVWDDTGTRHEDVVNAMNDLRKVLANSANAAPEQEPMANRPSEAERRSLVTECGLEWDDGSETSSNDPFAWATFDGEGSYDLRLYECNEDYRAEYIKRNGDKYSGWVIPLYTAPAPQREWQGLTKDEINNCAGAEIYPSTWAMAFARAIEAALRAKNTGEQA